MTDRELYENLLNLDEYWKVNEVIADDTEKTVTVHVSYSRPPEGYKCPYCERKSEYHDARTRKLRHFDTCDYKTWLKVRYPRVKCPRCGTVAIELPFARKEKSHFTTSFKNRIVALAKSTSTQKVAKDLDIDWHVIERIKQSGVKNGLKRQKEKAARHVKRLSVDEKSFRGRECVTIISDAGRKTVIAVLNGRDAATVVHWFRTQQVADFSKLQSISMDMAPPYIKAVREVFPNADELICFDRFHVARLFNQAVDKVRRRESARFRKGENPLLHTRFDWLRNSGKTDNRTSRRRKFLLLTQKPLETAKAWKLKEAASRLWEYTRESSAEKAWNHLIFRLSHARIRELKTLAKTIRIHLRGILNAILLRATNALAEARNSCIQRIKMIACGYRNKRRFAEEILFQFGGLNLTFR